ncbi:43722_t:CDS:2 [Gigaspora margarita]|uniref:43722_t:CDS:1 n=1 Tax=Gigaspora margarita TaxID=4874 RepID=A0ABN7UM19_GIGMA|nr:43722_t:CDS:2 [Gigaspora margarita]
MQEDPLILKAVEPIADSTVSKTTDWMEILEQEKSEENLEENSPVSQMERSSNSEEKRSDDSLSYDLQVNAIDEGLRPFAENSNATQKK